MGIAGQYLLVQRAWRRGVMMTRYRGTSIFTCPRLQKGGLRQGKQRRVSVRTHSGTQADDSGIFFLGFFVACVRKSDFHPNRDAVRSAGFRPFFIGYHGEADPQTTPTMRALH